MSKTKGKPVPRDDKHFATPSPDEGKAPLKPGATPPTPEQLAEDTLGRLLCPGYRNRISGN